MQSITEHKVQEAGAYTEMNYTSIKSQVYELKQQESDNSCKKVICYNLSLQKLLYEEVLLWQELKV